MDKFICYATLATGSKVKLTQEDYNKFQEMDNDSFLEVSGKVFKKSAVMEIDDIENYVDDKTYNYGQPYTALPPGIGFEGLITRETRGKAIELMAKGLKKAKAKFDRPTPEIDSLLKLARERYAFLKENREPINKYNV